MMYIYDIAFERMQSDSPHNDTYCVQHIFGKTASGAYTIEKRKLYFAAQGSKCYLIFVILSIISNEILNLKCLSKWLLKFWG